MSTSATADGQASLVMQTVKDLSALRKETYSASRNLLDELAASVSELPSTVINTDIGASVALAWEAEVHDVSSVEEPTWMQTAIDGLPTEAPTVPDVSYSPTAFTETAPAALTGSVGTPGAVGATTVTVEDLPEVPTITPVSVTVDANTLAATFSFTEPTYNGKISSDLQTAVANALSNPVLSQSYWDARLASLQADISEENVGTLRRASNAGAASWLPLPAEGRLALVDAANDASAKALQKARIELVLEQSRQAREDFWAAVEKGLAYEQMWVEYNNNVAQRALGAAEQLVNTAIQVHNSKASYYNALIASAKLDLEADQAAVARVLDSYRAELEGSAQKLSKSKQEIEEYQAQWSATIEAFNADSSRGQQQIQRFSELVRAWGTQTESEMKVAEFPLRKAEIEANVYSAQYGAVNAIASGVKTIMDARVGIESLKLDASKVEIDVEKTKNEIQLELGKLTQAAQETQAKLDIAQSQWVTGQADSMTSNLAQLTVGYAQAVAVASDVSLSSNAQYNKSASIDFNYHGDATSDRDPTFTV